MIIHFIKISIENDSISLTVLLEHKKESRGKTNLSVGHSDVSLTYFCHLSESKRGKIALKKKQKSGNPFKKKKSPGCVRKTRLAAVGVSVCSRTICPSSSSTVTSKEMHDHNIVTTKRSLRQQVPQSTQVAMDIVRNWRETVCVILNINSRYCAIGE